jgi:MFS family permease
MTQYLSTGALPGANKSLESHFSEHSDKMNHATRNVGPLQQSEAEPAIEEKGSDDKSRYRMSTPREVLFVAVVVVSHFTTQAAFAESMAPIAIISQTFGSIQNISQSAWGVAAYALSSGTFILISGRLGDMMGHRKIFILGYAWFCAWSIAVGASAYSKSYAIFDFCRAMQGIGPALLIPNALALLGIKYAPGLKKNLLFSLFGFMAPSGFVTGAVFSSLFAEKLWWPWAFWTFAMGCFVLCIASIIIIPTTLFERPSQPIGFDWAGALTGVAGLILLNVATTNGPIYGWQTVHVYLCLIFGLLFLAGFIVVEKRVKYPLLPIKALNSSIVYVLTCVFFGWGSFGIWLFYTIRFLQQIRHASALSVAAQFAPVPVSAAIAAGMTGFLLTHVPVSLVNLLSMIAFFTGCIVAGTMPVHQSYWAQMFVSFIIMPFGMDMSFPAATILLSHTMPQEHQGLAASLVVTVVNCSISLGLGFAGTVEKGIFDAHNHDLAWLVPSLRGGYYTGAVMAAAGILLGAFYFVKTLLRDGWKLLED